MYHSVIVIYATNEFLCKLGFSNCSRAIRKAQFTHKRVAYKILLFETTSLKLPNLLKTVRNLLILL
jgi:hypothetical protein